MKARVPFALLLAALLLALWSGGANAAEPATKPLPPRSDWLHYGYDSHFTSYNRMESTINTDNVDELVFRWGMDCQWPGDTVSATPAIWGDFLYLTASVTPLRALNAQTGQSLWEFGEHTSWRPPPTASGDGTVFLFQDSLPSDFYAIDGLTGKMKWEAPLGFDMGYNETAVVTVDEARDRVYLIENTFSTGGKLFALDKETGEVLWYKSDASDDAEFFGDYVLLEGSKIYAPAEVPMDGYPNYGDHMLRIDATTEEIDLTYDRPAGKPYHSLEHYGLCNDKLIVTFARQNEPDELVAYSVVTSTIAWSKSMPKLTGTIACNEDNNRIYVPTDPTLYALNAGTGDEVWKRTGLAEIRNPSVANGVVYYLSETNLYAIDEETHQQLFRYPLGAEAYETNQVAIANGMLFFSGNRGDCELIALGFPPPIRLPMVVRSVKW